jgi:hypothetical protein
VTGNLSIHALEKRSKSASPDANCNQGRIVICAGENQLVAQVEHEHVGVASVERAVKGRVGLRRKNDCCPRLANDARRAMIREGGFRADDDFLPFVCEEDDEIVFLPFVSRFVEPVMLNQFQPGVPA